MKKRFLSFFIIFCLFFLYAYFNFTSYADSGYYVNSNDSTINYSDYENSNQQNNQSNNSPIRGEYIEDESDSEENNYNNSDDKPSFIKGFEEFFETILGFLPKSIRKHLLLIVVILAIGYIIYGSIQASREIKREKKIKDIIYEDEIDEQKVSFSIKNNSKKNEDLVQKFKQKVQQTKTNNNVNERSTNNKIKKKSSNSGDNIIDDIKLKFRKKNNNKFVNDNVLDDIERKEKKKKKK